MSSVKDSERFYDSSDDDVDRMFAALERKRAAARAPSGSSSADDNESLWSSDSVVEIPSGKQTSTSTLQENADSVEAAQHRHSKTSSNAIQYINPSTHGHDGSITRSSSKSGSPATGPVPLPIDSVETTIEEDDSFWNDERLWEEIDRKILAARAQVSRSDVDPPVCDRGVDSIDAQEPACPWMDQEAPSLQHSLPSPSNPDVASRASSFTPAKVPRQNSAASSPSTSATSSDSSLSEFRRVYGLGPRMKRRRLSLRPSSPSVPGDNIVHNAKSEERSDRNASMQRPSASTFWSPSSGGLTPEGNRGQENLPANTTPHQPWDPESDTKDASKEIPTNMRANKPQPNKKNCHPLVDSASAPLGTRGCTSTTTLPDRHDADQAYALDKQECIRSEQDRAYILSAAFGLDVADPIEDQFVDTSGDQRQVKIDGAEIDPAMYAPPSHTYKQEPIVHHCTARNRPLAQRRQITVTQVFPYVNLWKNKFDTFNHLQSEISNTLAYSDDNVVVSSPTGSGKTAVFEMAMARFFTVDLHASGGHQSGPLRRVTRQRKIVYMAPSKALCEERFNDWSTRLEAMNIGVQVAIITGDGDPSDSFRDLSNAHLIVTTPEKFDSLTRRWTDNFFLLASIKLFLIDEVHLVADESRGSCIESVICRIHTIHRAATHVCITQADLQNSSYDATTPEAVNSVVRCIAVSATLPNIADIAAALDANESYTFDASYRPVPLTVHVIGQGHVGEGSQQFRFWSGLNRNVPEVLMRFSEQKPTIVFCHSKADTETLADLLANAKGIYMPGNSNHSIASQTKLTKLQRVLCRGVGYHHAGLDVEDRRLVERAFMEGRIRALCATSTLAMGVNLPAHLVVIKGTKAWRGSGNGYQDLSQSTLLQMIGRAGRPGFDTNGTAVIMTDNASKAAFQKLASSGLEAAKSQLLLKLDEVINTEVSQRVITSFASALDWMKGTLYFVQLKRKSTRLDAQEPHEDEIESHLSMVVQKSIQRLCDIGAIAVLNRGSSLVPLPAGRIMSQNLVDYQAMQQIVQLPFDASQKQVLVALTQMEGLHRPVRRCEKQCLNKAHKSLKYKLDGPPSKVRVQTPCQKAFVLLQASIGQVHLEEYALRSEMGAMVDYSSRMLSAIAEYSVQGSGHGQVALQSLRLRRSLATSLWCGKNGVLNQITGIGQATTANLKIHGIATFQDVLRASSEVLEKAAHRSSPFGSNLRKIVSKIVGSSLKVSARLEYVPGTSTPCTLVCDLAPSGEGSSGDSITSAGASPVTYHLLVFTDRSGGILMYKSGVSSKSTFRVDTPPRFGRITVAAVASLVGLDGTFKKCKNCDHSPIVLPHSLTRIPEKIELKGNAEVATSTVSSAGKAAPFNTSEKVSTKRLPDVGATYANVDERRELSSTLKTRMNNRGFTAPAGSKFRSEIEPITLCTPSPTVPPFNMATSRNPVSRGQAVQVSHQDRVAHESRRSREQHNQQALPGTDGAREVESLWVGGSTVVCDSSAQSLRTPSTVSTFQHSSTGWHKERREQHRTQQRAFTRHQDNPFNRFKHDPNDSEKQLELLTSHDSAGSLQGETIIPTECLSQLETAYRALPRRTIGLNRVAAPSIQRGGHRPIGGIYHQDCRELLAQKVEEANGYTSSRYSSPHLGSSYQQPAWAPHRHFPFRDVPASARSVAVDGAWPGSDIASGNIVAVRQIHPNVVAHQYSWAPRTLTPVVHHVTQQPCFADNSYQTGDQVALQHYATHHSQSNISGIVNHRDGIEAVYHLNGESLGPNEITDAELDLGAFGF